MRYNMHDMHQSCVDSFQKTKQKTAEIVVLIIIESVFLSKENINFIIVSNTVEKNHLNFFLTKSKRCTWIELIYDNYSLRN